MSVRALHLSGQYDLVRKLQKEMEEKLRQKAPKILLCLISQHKIGTPLFGAFFCFRKNQNTKNCAEVCGKRNGIGINNETRRTRSRLHAVSPHSTKSFSVFSKRRIVYHPIDISYSHHYPIARLGLHFSPSTLLFCSLFLLLLLKNSQLF